VILLVLVAFVARVDAAPGDAPVSPPVREAKLPTGVEAPDGRPADDAAEADEADDDGDADDAAEADEADDEIDEINELHDARIENTGIASEGVTEAFDTENADPSDLAPSALQALELLAGGTGDDRGALADDEGAAGDEAGQLALREAEQAPAGTTPDDDASAAAAPAGAQETYEAWIRRPRLSRWGRLDVSLAWRQLWSEPMHTTPHRSDSVWLVATWRR